MHTGLGGWVRRARWATHTGSRVVDTGGGVECADAVEESNTGPAPNVRVSTANVQTVHVVHRSYEGHAILCEAGVHSPRPGHRIPVWASVCVGVWVCRWGGSIGVNAWRCVHGASAPWADERTTMLNCEGRRRWHQVTVVRVERGRGERE